MGHDITGSESGTTQARCRKDAKPTTMDPREPGSWPKEIGGQPGPEPTRYGDWEKNGRCSDF